MPHGRHDTPSVPEIALNRFTFPWRFYDDEGHDLLFDVLCDVCLCCLLFAKAAQFFGHDLRRFHLSY